jgi:hypothetical protein
LRALAATGALGRINKRSTAFQLHLEIASLPVHPHEIRVSQDLDIQMAADADQARRQNTHGAVIRGEGLVELRHRSADAAFFFGEIHLETGVGQVEGGLHASHAPAHD